jgi:hypothetical protein
MIKFKATNLNGEGSYNGTHEDLGECLVSKFEIDGVEFYSVVPKNSTQTQRMENDSACAAEYGYKIDYDSTEEAL